MSEHLPLIDADSHVAEPADLWEGEFMHPEYRGASPYRFVDCTDRKGRPTTKLYDGGVILLENAAYAAAAGLPIDQLAAGVLYKDANKGGWDITQRLADMDSEGIDYQIINPSSPGLRLGFIREPALAVAMCSAYNDWVTAHCEGSNGRVLANMVLPWQYPDLALEEFNRVSSRDCFRGVVIMPAPAYPCGFVGDKVFEPIYAAIAEAGHVLVFHSCAPESGLVGPITRHYIKGRPYWHGMFYGLILGFPIEGWAAFTQLVFEGVLDRHPTLKIMITESHGGWAVTALERMDEYAKGGQQLRAEYQLGIDLLPSEYFARQAFIVFESDEIAMGFSAEHIGKSMLWALDYPHADATFPGGSEEFRTNIEKLPPATQRAIAWDNPARAFNITA